LARRRRAQVRKIRPDYKYGSILVAKFINSLMQSGKKSTAEKIFYDAIDIISKETKEDGIEVFKRAINNVKPILEVKPRRIGGATYQVPIEVRPERRQSLAIRWIIKAVKQRKEKETAFKLARELMDAVNQQGTAFKMRENTHKMAEANKAFAHYRW